MPRCPICGEEIYWVIVKGKVLAIPFSYTDVKSEKAEILKYNEIKESALSEMLRQTSNK
mgnify:CR=1 FL=1